MNRSAFVTGIGVSALTVLGARDAKACGGCFHPPVQIATDITDERMLLTVSETQTTLYDQIRYSGSPASFAWVLPIHGTVIVGLSADVLFDSIDELTATQIDPPPSSCPPRPSCGGAGCGGSTSEAAFAGAGAGAVPPVTVTKQQNVGPYATVQLHATDSSALSTWLSQNGFVIPDDVTPVLDEYVTEGFDFLAMKLLPNQGVQSMRPVRVSSPGASFSLPLRMAAIGTGTTVGITIWVVADGRYELQNFPFFHIDDSALVWDWSTSSSNYTTLRAQHESALSNKGWEIESSIDVNQQTITNVILSGGQVATTFGGASQTPSDPTQDYLPVVSSDVGATDGGGEGGSVGAIDGGGDAVADSDASAGSQGGAGGDASGPVAMSAEEVRAADIATLFVGLTGPTVRITRIRSDIAHTAMTADLVVQASADQSVLSNVRTVTQSVNETCPIYKGCDVVGTGTPAQSAASTKGGCAATPGMVASWSSGSGILAGLLGLALARATRSRRRRLRKTKT